MDGIARIVNACLMALRPVLHASWREKCSEIGILADESWITSSGAEIIDILRAVDFDAKSQPRPLCPHRFETYDFEAMYPNLPDVVVVVVVVSHIQRIGCQPEKKLLYTVANPARGLLNREKKKKKKSGSAPPPPPLRALLVRRKKKKKKKSRGASTCLGATQAGVTQVVSVRLASVQGFLRLVS